MAKFLFKLIISLLFVGYLFINVDWQLMKETIVQIDLSFYIFSTLIALICPTFLAFKYHLLIKNTSLDISIRRLIEINFISRFYALFLPSALGPEAVRWYKVTQNKQGRSFFLASTMLERICFLLILLIFGALPLFFYTENNQIILLRNRIMPLLAVVASVLSCGLIFFIFPGIQKKIKRFILRSLPIKNDGKIYNFLINFELKQSAISIIGPLLLLGLLWQFFFLFRMMLLFSSLGLPLSFVDIAWMSSLVLLLQVMPISFAGIGIREGAFAYLFPFFGLPPEKGIIIGFLFFTQMLFFSFIGAILNLYESK